MQSEHNETTAADAADLVAQAEEAFAGYVEPEPLSDEAIDREMERELGEHDPGPVPEEPGSGDDPSPGLSLLHGGLADLSIGGVKPILSAQEEAREAEALSSDDTPAADSPAETPSEEQFKEQLELTAEEQELRAAWQQQVAEAGQRLAQLSQQTEGTVVGVAINLAWCAGHLSAGYASNQSQFKERAEFWKRVSNDDRDRFLRIAADVVGVVAFNCAQFVVPMPEPRKRILTASGPLPPVPGRT